MEMTVVVAVMVAVRMMVLEIVMVTSDGVNEGWGRRFNAAVVKFATLSAGGQCGQQRTRRTRAFGLSVRSQEEYSRSMWWTSVK